MDRQEDERRTGGSTNRMRRRFLKEALLFGLSAGLAGCAPAPATRIATRVVEATRLVEKIVEVTRVVTETPPATAVPEEERGMIWYVDIEHEKALADASRAPDFDRVRSQRARVCGEAAGMHCEAVLYQQVSRERAKMDDLRAIAISGNTADWAEYDFETFKPLFELVQSGEYPTIGFCGGHQLIGLMVGAKCDAIRRLNPGEPDPGGFAPGWFKEVGFLPVHVVKDDPLFDDLGSDPVFFESHYWEIKEVPDGFDLLASSKDVRVQVIRHKQYPIYGTQFHPEASSAEHRDGFTLLKNFFRSTGVRKDG